MPSEHDSSMGKADANDSSRQKNVAKVIEDIATSGKSMDTTHTASLQKLEVSAKASSYRALELEMGEPPKDRYHLCYLSYFALGAGVLFPWNAFLTAVDYFQDQYPDQHVDRTFCLVYMSFCMTTLALVVYYAFGLSSNWRIYIGFIMYLISLAIIPILDVITHAGLASKGSSVNWGITLLAVVFAGMGDGFGQGSVFGSSGHMPPLYTQAVVSGTAVSGMAISFLRIFTKAVFPQDANGLRYSTFLYFGCAFFYVVCCILIQRALPNLQPRKYYDQLLPYKSQRDMKSGKTSSDVDDGERLTIVGLLRAIWPLAIAMWLTYVVTISIFPGFLAEDVEARLLGDWYPIILLTIYNCFDFVGKSSPMLSFFQCGSPKLLLISSVTRIGFYGLYCAAAFGPTSFTKSDIGAPVYVSLITVLLGFTNGYCTANLFIEAPRRVHVVNAEKVEMLMVWFLLFGIFTGSCMSWLWLL